MSNPAALCRLTLALSLMNFSLSCQRDRARSWRGHGWDELSDSVCRWRREKRQVQERRESAARPSAAAVSVTGCWNVETPFPPSLSPLSLPYHPPLSHSPVTVKHAVWFVQRSSPDGQGLSLSTSSLSKMNDNVGKIWLKTCEHNVCKTSAATPDIWMHQK